MARNEAGTTTSVLCLSVRRVDHLVTAIVALAPGFGGIDLAEIPAPACFEVSRRLRQAALRIPVFHDRQHGVPVVVLAGLRNALRAVNKQVEAARLVATSRLDQPSDHGGPTTVIYRSGD
jgi:malate dehydrogenase (oxaloacetate-decarboxylating)